MDRIDCTFETVPWSFASEQRATIDAHWEARLRRQPKLFDGQVLMLTRGAVEHDVTGDMVFRGACTAVAFRSFLAWRDFGAASGSFRNGFGMAALRGSDGAFVLGEMAPHTATAGRIYFPSGTPDLNDVADQRLDLEGSVRRELVEETGLDLATLVFAPGFIAVEDGTSFCFMKEVCAHETAASLVERIHGILGRQDEPELSRMHIVRSTADITPAMPPFVAAYLSLSLDKPVQSG